MPDGLQRLLGALLAVLTAPVMAALGLLVRAETPGPAIFRAPRVGREGRIFTCYKLRTMHDRGSAVAHAVSISGDPRVTGVGRALRRTRLDELPQFWNVARGEMRLVGPRPEDPRFVDFADPVHRVVFRAMPGITGLSQLAYIRESDLLVGSEPDTLYRERILPEKVAIDARYLANRSASLDIWILWKTLRAMSGHVTPMSEIDRRCPSSRPLPVTPRGDD